MLIERMTVLVIAPAHAERLRFAFDFIAKRQKKSCRRDRDPTPWQKLEPESIIDS